MAQRGFHTAYAKIVSVACLTVLCVTLTGFLGILKPTSAFAADVSSSVTKITTDATTYSSNSTVTCTLSFDAGQLASGDTIAASWTSSDADTISATGTSDTLDVVLENDSTAIIGTAVVTENGVTITLNDSVANYQSGNGSVTFTITVANTGTADGTVTISAGDVSSAVTVSPEATVSATAAAVTTESTSTGALALTNKVTGTAGNTSTRYTFKLSQSGLSGTYDVSYTGTEDDTTVHPSTITFTDGVATLQLKDGETATISNVPTGTMAVSESGLGSSTAELTVAAQSSTDDSATALTVDTDDGSTSAYSASISTDATTTVTVTNNSDLVASTGIDDGNWSISLLVFLATGAAALLLIWHSIKGGGYARKE
ncbi:MAG: DUF7601 domain-containing protein [Coriobacteriales bacterium]|jgi:hypothetical protein